jgi:uncharacterized protein (UPF0548 family)
MSGEFSYAEVGATRAPSLTVPRGYSTLTRRVRAGGREAFDTVADLVLGFGLQRAAGFQVTSSHPTAQDGTDVVMRAGFGPIRVVAPTRVVYVVDEEDRRGFAYGTLPGHPESGEELFLVSRDEESTWFEVRAFSRPGRWFTRLAGPVGRVLQRRATGQYVDAVRRAGSGS